MRATANGLRDATPARWTWKVASAPVPHEITCGEILTRSIVVTNDLIDCPGNGIIVGANGITVDLDGHTIDGVGLDGGIVNMGFDSVTIKNGVVTEFDYGVLLNPGSAKGVVTGIRAELNQEAGIALADADEGGFGNTIRENTVVLNEVGIALYSNTRHTIVRDNHVGGNLGDGVRLEMANENPIQNNEIANSAGFGVYIFGGHDNVVRDNELDANLGGVAVGEELIPSNRTLVEYEHDRRQPRRRHRRHGLGRREDPVQRRPRRRLGRRHGARAERPRQGQRPQRQPDGHRRRGVERHGHRLEQRQRRPRQRHRGRASRRTRRS